MSDIGLRALVLDRTYRPISLFPIEHIPVEDAVTRVLNGTCAVVAEYERQILTRNLVMRWPSVIVRLASKSAAGQQVGLNQESLYYRDHGLCAYCDARLEVKDVTCDHVVPASAGGQREWSNVVASCARCNSLKGSSPAVGEWKPRRRPWVPTYKQLLERRRTRPIKVDHESWVPHLGEWRAPVVIGSRGR